MADFISENAEPILAEWESFARSIWPGTPSAPTTLRDHAADILRATVVDMKSAQTAAEQEDKSKGGGDDDATSVGVDWASDIHGALRVEAGFDMAEVLAEYRALRASVLRLWKKSEHTLHPEDLDDITRFNETMDQSLTKATESFVRHAGENRKLLADEQIARLGAEAGNHAKEIFLMTLSHEMRTPLNAIAGWAEILRQEKCTEKLLKEGAEVITRNVAAQIKIIDDILDVSGIIGGKLQLEMVECDLIDIINAAIESTRASADAKDIDLSAELDPASRLLSCDADRMQKVVWNLLSNALKFTPRGGRVTISLSRDSHATRMRVTDTGIGIAPEFISHVFERFQQADGSVTRQFEGIGLGLAIVKHIIEMHGGTVEAMSSGAGRGATFTVTLPATPGQANVCVTNRLCA